MRDFFSGIIFLIVGLGSVVSIAEPKQVGDRILIEIDNSFYAQSHMETYLLVKEALRVGLSKTSLVFVNKYNWQVAFETFQTDMLIHQDTQRMGSFFPRKVAIEKAHAVIKEIRRTNVGFQRAAKRLGLIDVTLSRVVTRVLQVEAYRQSKVGDAAVGTSSKLGWLGELRERTVIRRFKGSDIYVEIDPSKEGVNN